MTVMIMGGPHDGLVIDKDFDFGRYLILADPIPVEELAATLRGERSIGSSRYVFSADRTTATYKGAGSAAGTIN